MESKEKMIMNQMERENINKINKQKADEKMKQLYDVQVKYHLIITIIAFFYFLIIFYLKIKFLKI